MAALANHPANKDALHTVDDQSDQSAATAPFFISSRDDLPLQRTLRLGRDTHTHTQKGGGGVDDVGIPTCSPETVSVSSSENSHRTYECN